MRGLPDWKLRVLRLRGAEVTEDSFQAGAPRDGKGQALWMEGIPKEVQLDPKSGMPAAGLGVPQANPYIAPPVSNGGPKELRLKGGYTPGVDTAAMGNAPGPGAENAQPVGGNPLPTALGAPMPPQPMNLPEGGALPPPTPTPAAAAPQPEAANVETGEGKKLSRKEKKRKKKEEESAKQQQVQSIEFGPQGYQSQTLPGSPQDGFGDTSPVEKKKKR